MNAKTVESIAERLLASRPDTPVKVRLLRDILPGSSPSELKQALADLKEHPEYARLQKGYRAPGKDPAAPMIGRSTSS